jgi:hypothetical protein
MIKLNSIYIKQIIFTFLLISCSISAVWSQETFPVTRNVPGLFYGFSIGPSKTQIQNTGSVYDSVLLNSKVNSVFGTAEIGYFFSDYFGISSGLGYGSYKTKLNLKKFEKNFDAIDSENELFNMSVTGSDIQELQTVNFLSIPVCIQFRLPFNQTFGLFLKAGINFSLPISYKYNSRGTFTYLGYYPKYNVFLDSLPAYGFVKNKLVESKGSLNINKICYNTLLSLGLDINITKTIQIGLAANFNNALLKESYSNSQTNVSPDKFLLTPDANHINSFFEGISHATAQSVGFEITLKFFVK